MHCETHYMSKIPNYDYTMSCRIESRIFKLNVQCCFINNSLKLCIKCLEDKMVNKILSMHILKEISLVYRISKSNAIHEVFEFIIRKYSNRN
jgi:bisphosphoglycerate-dependent phosphoglycerate mutase